MSFHRPTGGRWPTINVDHKRAQSKVQVPIVINVPGTTHRSNVMRIATHTHQHSNARFGSFVTIETTAPWLHHYTASIWSGKQLVVLCCLIDSTSMWTIGARVSSIRFLRCITVSQWHVNCALNRCEKNNTQRRRFNKFMCSVPKVWDWNRYTEQSAFEFGYFEMLRDVLSNVNYSVTFASIGLLTMLPHIDKTYIY